MTVTVACDLHGPMKYRVPLKWHECPGFDGEGAATCGVMIVYDEDLARGWVPPGTTVRQDP